MKLLEINVSYEILNDLVLKNAVWKIIYCENMYIKKTGALDWVDMDVDNHLTDEYIFIF